METLYNLIMWSPRMGMHSLWLVWDMLYNPVGLRLLMLLNVLAAALVVVFCAVRGRPLAKNVGAIITVSFALTNFVGLVLVFSDYSVVPLETLANSPAREAVMIFLPRPVETAAYA